VEGKKGVMSGRHPRSVVVRDESAQVCYARYDRNEQDWSSEEEIRELLKGPVLEQTVVPACERRRARDVPAYQYSTCTKLYGMGTGASHHGRCLAGSEQKDV
jgi:hypothetical protein